MIIFSLNASSKTIVLQYFKNQSVPGFLPWTFFVIVQPHFVKIVEHNWKYLAALLVEGIRLRRRETNIFPDYNSIKLSKPEISND
jgi:hypothetical protein